MAETDIFNPTNWVAAGLPFNPNPSYGFTRKMGANRQVTRPRLGLYPSRDSMNGGHIFSLAWLNTDITTAQRVIAFYHQSKHGYFTLIDQDWNQRQYVGRFMTEPELGHPANGKYSFQGVVFEEMPQARMLTYPSLALYGHTLYVVDDYLNPLVALMQGTWATQVSALAPAGSTAQMPSALEAIDVAPVVGDWAQTGYVGFGFQMIFRLAATLGVINLYLDDVQIVGQLDLSNGTYTVAAGPTVTVTAASGGTPATVTVTYINVPLDQHRVKVAVVGASGGGVVASAGGGTSIIYPALEYIY